MIATNTGRNVFIVTIYVLAYVLLDWVSYINPVLPFAITAWNPPPGLSLALLIIRGPKYAPALFLASLTADFVVRQGSASPLTAIVLTTILTFGYWGLALVLVRWMKLSDLRTLRHLTVFSVVTSVLCMVIAFTYIGAHAVLGLIPLRSVPEFAMRFWVGDFIGVLVVTPFLMVLFRQRSTLPARWLTWKFWLPNLATGAALWVVFGLDPTNSAKLFYVLFLPLIWISVWHGFQGATWTLLLIQIGLIVAVETMPFTEAVMAQFQLLMLALAFTGLFLGMTQSEREATQHALLERERTLDRVLRSAAISETASALAHELNQPLSAAVTYGHACKLLLERGAESEELGSPIDKMHAELNRASDVVKRLREFFRTGAIRLDSSSLESLINESLRTIKPRLEQAGIAVATLYPPRLLNVLADKTHFSIVLHNLLTNAMESINSNIPSQRNINIHVSPKGNGLVCVTVEDSGPGFSTEAEGRLFERFVTSKAHGMGIGLAMSRSIIESHGGTLWVDQFRPSARVSFTLRIANSQSDPG